jgi:hypothetical protein
MKITYELKRTLVSTAKADVVTAQEKLESIKRQLEEAEKTLWWAEGLVTGQELSMTQPITQPKVSNNMRGVLYFFASKSGGKGHYIEKSDNTITCSCPGFQNRNSCWATREVLSEP